MGMCVNKDSQYDNNSMEQEAHLEVPPVHWVAFIGRRSI